MSWYEKLQAMFGDQWVTSFAKMAGLNRRTVYHWKHGKFNIPEAVEDKVHKTYDIWFRG